jgi:5-methylcytosine-specific restriction endonuclease McrA
MRARERARRWQAANPARASAKKKRWAELHRDRVYAIKARRREARRGPGAETITPESLLELLRAQNGCCAYCTVALGPDRELDHKVPLARGGAHHIDNVCWACPPCNRHKNALTDREFRESLEAFA